SAARIFFSLGVNCSSLLNKLDGCGFWSDAAGSHSDSSCCLISAGNSSHTSSHVAVSFAPCLIKVLGPQELREVTFPGTANNSRLCSRAQRAVMRVPLYSPAS